MEEKNSIGKVVIGSGTQFEKEIEINDFIQSVYPDNRLVSISNLADEAGYIITIENPESSGRSNQKMWLSYDSFMGLIATACIYCTHNNIDIGIEAEKMKGSEIKFNYAKREDAK